MPNPLPDPETALHRLARARGPGVIEASAGTGKTHTLETLFLRLLRDDPSLSVDNILVVTFSEKATGELRTRLRARLAKEVDRIAADVGDGWPARLRAALERFDQAPIYTLHGFCQRTLSRYAFEQGQAFDLTLLDDPSLFDRLYHDVIRVGWRRAWLPRLPAALQREAAAEGYYRERVRTLVKILGPDDRLLPDVDFPDLDEPLAALFSELLREAGTVPAPPDDVAPDATARFADDTRAGSELAALFEEVAAGKVWHYNTAPAMMRKGLPALWRALVRARTLTARADGRRPVAADWIECARLVFDCDYQEFVARLEDTEAKALAKADKADKDGKARKKAAPAPAVAPESAARLTRIARGLLALVPWVRQFSKIAVANAARAVRHLTTAWKEEHGLFDFDDLLTRLRDALSADTPSAARLRSALRSRYRVALVDEFQDTDPVQWAVFGTLFAPDAGDVAAASSGAPPRLIVVGDPKQAIYAFRHASVSSYHKAVAALRDRPEMAETRLQCNYRSDPELLHVFNRLFLPWPECPGTEPWFPPEDGPQLYPPDGVQPPPPDQVTARRVRDDTGRLPLTLVDLLAPAPDAAGEDDAGDGGSGTAELPVGICRTRLAAFIAREIAALLDARGLWVATPDGRSRRLDAGDIAILYPSKTGLEILERALRGEPEASGGARRPAIPYTLDRVENLYRGMEAREWSLLLRALAEPGDETVARGAWLSGFFDAEAIELAARPPGPDHPFRDALRRWGRLARERRWAAALSAALAESGVEARALARPDGERRLTNLRHLAEILEAETCLRAHDPASLADWLDARLRDGCAGDEGMPRRLESERPLVRLLTMHSSKGLQFPVVFCYGAFPYKGCEKPREHVYWEDPDGRRVIDLACSSADRPVEARRQEARDWRNLLYVAFTRARFKLYLPDVPAAWGRSRTSRGLPATAIAARWPRPEDGASGDGAAPDDEGRDGVWIRDGVARVPWNSVVPPVMLRDALHAPDGGSNAGMEVGTPAPPSPSNAIPVSGGEPSLDWDALPAGAAARAFDRRRVTLSYSSFRVAPTATETSSASDRFRLDDETDVEADIRHDDDRTTAPGDGAPPLETAHMPADAESNGIAIGVDEYAEIPRGVVTGRVLHQVLERTDFRRIADLRARDDGERAALADMTPGGLGHELAAAMAYHQWPEAASRTAPVARVRRLAGRMAWRALNTPLALSGARGPTTSLALAASRRMAEWSFLFPLPSDADPAKTRWLGFPARDGYVLGYVDLIFEYEGRVYILDWKTTTAPDGDYAPAALDAVMAAHDYTRQARVYALAAERWLAARCDASGVGVPTLGGVFFLFLRGLDGQTDRGVHFTPVDAGRRARWERELFGGGA